MTEQSSGQKSFRLRNSPEFKTEALGLAYQVGVPVGAKRLGRHESQLYA